MLLQAKKKKKKSKYISYIFLGLYSEKACTPACTGEGPCRLWSKKGSGESWKRKESSCLLKRISTSRVINLRMKWEWGSAIYFFNHCYKKTNLVLWSHFLQKSDVSDFIPKWNVQFGRGEMSYMKTSVKYICSFFFFFFQPAAATITQTG